MHIAEMAVNRPVATMMCFCAMLMLGAYSLQRMKVDFLPDIDVPNLLVKTECPGFDSRYVEENITRLLESSLATIQEVESVESVSRDGLSLIHVNFSWGSNMDIGFIKVRGRLDRMQENLPDLVERPIILRFDPASVPIMILVVTGDRIERPKTMKDRDHALVELKDVSTAVIKRRLEQLEGVAYAQVAGGLEREIKVQLNGKKMRIYKIGFSDVESALSKFNVQALGGTISDGHQYFPLRINAEYASIEEIYDTPIKTEYQNKIIYLRDVAYIEDNYKERTGYTRFNGKEVITLYLFKEAGANTVETSAKVYKDLYNLGLEYPEFEVISVYDQAEFIQKAIENVLQSLYLGVAAAFFVLFFFLRDLRNVLIIGISIPSSLVITLIFMDFFSISLNIISLGGLALGIGILVDNSIVVLENIHRYREIGYSLRQATVVGTREVSTAIIASTLTTVSVFLPLIYIRGFAGALFYDQSVTIALSLSTSLVISQTLLPVLASRTFFSFRMSTVWSMGSYSPVPLLGDDRGLLARIVLPVLLFIANTLYTVVYGAYRVVWVPCIWLVGLVITSFQQLFLSFLEWYEHVLEGILRHRWAVCAITLLIFCVSLLLLWEIEREIMPKVDQKKLVISAELPIGTKLQVTAAEIEKLENQLLQKSDTRTVLSSVGITGDMLNREYQPSLNKAILDWEIEGRANIFDNMIFLEKLKENFKSMELKIDKRETVFNQVFQQDRDEFDVEIYGTDLEVLERLSGLVVDFLLANPLFENVTSNLKKNKRELQLEVNREALRYFDISVADLVSFLRQQIKGSIPTQFNDQSEKVDIRVAIEEESLIDLQELLQLEYPAKRLGKNTVYVPLTSLISIVSQTGFQEIYRKDQTRTVRVKASTDHLEFSQAKELVENQLHTVKIPSGHWYDIGTHRRRTSAEFEEMLLVASIAAALVYFILSAQFESVRVPLVILMSIPLSLIGVATILWITGNTLNIITLLGLIVLVGIVVNDAIIKVDFIHRLNKEDIDRNTAIIQAGSKRFRPIWMTTATTICGLLPIATASGSGSELWKPLAWVVIGGLFVSTLLILFVIPAIYSLVRPKSA